MDSSQAQDVVSGPWGILPACRLPVQSMGDQCWFATRRLSACDLPLTSPRHLAVTPGDGAHQPTSHHCDTAVPIVRRLSV